MIANNRLAARTKIGYSTFNCGESIAYNLFYTYFLLFMTDYAGVGPAVAGTISLIAVLWDGVTDAVVGYISDRSTNPKGRRRPFMSRFLIPFGIMLVLLFSDFGFTGPAQVAFYLIMNILFWLFFTLVDVPAITLGGEITDNPHEKRSIRSWATIMNYVGFLLATAFAPQMVAYFNRFFANICAGWTVTAGIYAALLVICYIVALAATRGTDAPLTREEAAKTAGGNIFKSMFATMKLKSFRGLWIYCVVFQASVFLCTSTLIYVIYYVCNGTDNDATVLFLAYGVFTIVVSPIMDKIALKVNNKIALIVGMLLHGVALIVFGTIFPLTLSTIFIMMFFVAVGMAGYYVLSYAMVYEVAEVSALKLGQNSSTGVGTFIAFYQCAQKFGGALGMWGAGIALELVHYDPANITDTAVQGIRFVATTFAGIVVVVSVIAILFYKLKPGILAKLQGMLHKEKLTQEDQEFISKNL